MKSTIEYDLFSISTYSISVFLLSRNVVEYFMIILRVYSTNKYEKLSEIPPTSIENLYFTLAKNKPDLVDLDTIRKKRGKREVRKSM